MNAKKLMTFVLFSAWISMTQAQDANQILSQIQKKYNAINSVCADFKQTFHWQLADETQIFTGSVCTRNGVQFRIESADQIIVTDGKTIWTQSASNKQVLIDDAAESDEDNPFLKSFMQNYIDNYNAKLAGEETIDGKPYWQLLLQAKSEDEFARTIEVWVDKTTYYMIKIVQTDINDNVSTYEVSRIDLGAKLNDASFKLIPPSGYEVVDMRQN